VTASAVCESARVDSLNALVDHQLIQQEAYGQPEARGVMLEIIREYALAELNAGHEYEPAAQAHATCFLQLAETVDDELEPAWLTQMEQEHDNLRAALRWTLAHAPTTVGCACVSHSSGFGSHASTGAKDAAGRRPCWQQQATSRPSSV
jgi:predicted ATPase